MRVVASDVAFSITLLATERNCYITSDLSIQDFKKHRVGVGRVRGE